jgi:hypothetical protein
MIGLTRHLIYLLLDRFQRLGVPMADARDGGTANAIDNPTAIFQGDVDALP